jgi:hypothetical protein
MGTTLRRTFITLLFPALLLVALATGAIGAGNNEKVTLFHQITVSVNAVPAHMRHGDVPVDDYGDCP